MNTFKQILAALAFLFCAMTMTRADEVDRCIERQLRRLHIPGASLAVVRNGRIIKARGYGLADLQLNAPATKATAGVSAG